MISFREHMKEPGDLTTTYNETRAGFISIALEKNKRATPYIDAARILKNRIKLIKDPLELLEMGNIRTALIAASGISVKASKYLGDSGCDEAVKEFIDNFLIPAGESFREELIFRFLLTKGDSLGGSMRNIVGVLAKRKLNRTIMAALSFSDQQYFWFNKNSKQWEVTPEDFETLDDSKGLFWLNNKGESRTLFYDITVPLIKNNIDIILLSSSKDACIKESISNPGNFIALGELKGGIDPAGADEHWKTARTAIDRIITGFKQEKLNPHIFYIGAAIAKKMAEEIFDYLATGYLDNAANLTKEDQMASLTEWLISI